MADNHPEIDLNTIRKYPDTIGNNIYGNVLLETSRSEFGVQLCCLNPDWKSDRNSNECYGGKIGTWLGELSEQGKKGRPYLIEIDGEKKVIKAIPVRSRWSKYRNSDVFNLKELRQSLRQRASDGATQECIGLIEFDYQYIGMDDFANEAIVGTIVKQAFEGSNMPKLFNDIEYTSICGNYGILLMDHADLSDLCSFSKTARSDVAVVAGPNRMMQPKVTATIIKQVAAGLDFLQDKVQFIHSDLKVQNILVSSESVRGVYKGVDLSSAGFSIRIADFGNASATMKSLSSTRPKDIRVFNEIRATRYLPGGTANYKLKADSKQNCVKIELGKGLAGGNLGQCKDSYWWKLPSNFSVKVSLITAHSGMPFYRSYDYYIFMITLMMCPPFFHSVMSDARLKGRVWDSLWLGDELDKVTNEVKKYHRDDPSLGRALKVLTKFHMRCDALPYSLELLKSY